jgi:hypothetical protein
MISYKLIRCIDGKISAVQRTDGWSIPFDPDNTDYQAYLAWLAERNTPLPADEVTQ